MIVKLKESPTVSKLKNKSAFSFSQSALLSLYHTHTQLYIIPHPIAVMFCVATSFWCRFICECVLSCVSVCMNIPRYECTSSKSLSDSCLNGWPPLFQLSKWLTHRWTWSAVCRCKLPQMTRAQQSRPRAINTLTLTDLMQDWIKLQTTYRNFTLTIFLLPQQSYFTEKFYNNRDKGAQGKEYVRMNT